MSSQSKTQKKIKLTAKYGLHADKTTLCAFRNLPSAANVQSTNVPFSRSVSNTLISVLWWLFQRRQNCWSSSMVAMEISLYTPLCRESNVSGDEQWLSIGNSGWKIISYNICNKKDRTSRYWNVLFMRFWLSKLKISKYLKFSFYIIRISFFIDPNANTLSHTQTRKLVWKTTIDLDCYDIAWWLMTNTILIHCRRVEYIRYDIQCWKKTISNISQY